MAAKKYRCKVITAYKDTAGSYHSPEQEAVFIVVAATPHEARLIAADKFRNISPEKRRTNFYSPGAGREKWALEITKITAAALKEDQAMRLMNAPTLIDLDALSKEDD